MRRLLIAAVTIVHILACSQLDCSGVPGGIEARYLVCAQCLLTFLEGWGMGVAKIKTCDVFTDTLEGGYN